MAKKILRRRQNPTILADKAFSYSFQKNFELLAFDVEYFTRRMEQTILSDSQQQLLTKIGDTNLAEGFYLAGGTSLAIQLQHRQSDDFDFFSEKEFDLKVLQEKLGEVFSYQLVLSERKTLYVRVKDISISYIHYQYPLLRPVTEFQKGIFLASIEDIAAMKLATIAARGAKRDFVDLFYICNRNFSLDKVFELYQQRFQPAASDRYHLLRSVTYFDDAEDDPMPIIKNPTEWRSIKQFLIAEARKLQ